MNLITELTAVEATAYLSARGIGSGLLAANLRETNGERATWPAWHAIEAWEGGLGDGPVSARWWVDRFGTGLRYESGSGQTVLEIEYMPRGAYTAHEPGCDPAWCGEQYDHWHANVYLFDAACTDAHADRIRAELAALGIEPRISSWLARTW